MTNETNKFKGKHWLQVWLDPGAPVIFLWLCLPALFCSAFLGCSTFQDSFSSPVKTLASNLFSPVPCRKRGIPPRNSPASPLVRLPLVPLGLESNHRGWGRRTRATLSSVAISRPEFPEACEVRLGRGGP